MAMPFRVFDGTSHRLEEKGTVILWCVRCERWIPITENWESRPAYDPHILDHLKVWQVMREVDLNSMWNES